MSRFHHRNVAFSSSYFRVYVISCFLKFTFNREPSLKSTHYTVMALTVSRTYPIVGQNVEIERTIDTFNVYIVVLTLRFVHFIRVNSEFYTITSPCCVVYM